MPQQNELWKCLKSRLQELGLSVSEEQMGEEGRVSVLRIVLPLPTIGENVLTELIQNRLLEKGALLQIYTTMLLDIPSVCNVSLGQYLIEENFLCPLGSFGLFTEAGQLYHKYNLLLEDESEDTARRITEELLAILALIQELLEQKMPEAAAWLDRMAENNAGNG